MTITPALLDEIEAVLGDTRQYAWSFARYNDDKRAAGVCEDADAVLAKLRSARSSDPTPAMSAETMREAAANVADKCAEQNKAAAIKLRKRQHSETDTWNSNELDDTAAEAEAIAITIRALPLTAPKDG